MRFLLLAATVLLAVHVLVTTLLSLAVALILPLIEAPLAHLAPRRRASLLLALCVLPSGMGLAAAFGLALPAWLLHEPRGTGEAPGLFLLLLAAAGLVLIGARLGLALQDSVRTARQVGRWVAEGEALSALPFDATCVHSDWPLVALAGAAKPRLLLSDSVVRALLPAELEAVVEHERAHAATRENLRRLLLRASPDPLGFLPAGRRLRSAFEEASEVAADQDACRRVSPLVLASALLKVASLVPAGQRLELSAAALLSEGGIAGRVRALLAVRADATPEVSSLPAWWSRVLGLLGALLGAALCASALPRAHALLEALVHLR